MTRRRPLLALLAILALAGCGALEPYPTVAAAPEPGAAAGHRVAICYNGVTTALAEAQREAQQECSGTLVSEPVRTDWSMQACPLLLPTRATFLCTPKK